jgi:glycine cleavage system H protein
MEFPEEFKYTKDHTWLLVSGEIAKVGITEFAQSELGEIVYVDLPRVGQVFKQSEIFGSVEAVKTTSDLFMPVSGEVIEINPRLKKEATLVNSSPFNDGWMIAIKIIDKKEVSTLQSATEYKTGTGN